MIRRVSRISQGVCRINTNYKHLVVTMLLFLTDSLNYEHFLHGFIIPCALLHLLRGIIRFCFYLTLIIYDV